ncbi:3-oxoacyl-[acyl-carrier-protein] synthase III C-terminal domain-containing protein [Streptomyces sp. NPDC000609]|uniref:3-oxoacyl-[acyl-carrier-protein] synthase III C-terminal domain-containing protein n=1 Tax=Streptomyces sp. NPDC000609 TaxID=3160957 RepID=UPI003393AAF8
MGPHGPVRCAPAHAGHPAQPPFLDHAHRPGRLDTGEPVVLAGFGGGVTMGTSLISLGNRWFAPGQQQRKD